MIEKNQLIFREQGARAQTTRMLRIFVRIFEVLMIPEQTKHENYRSRFLGET